MKTNTIKLKSLELTSGSHTSLEEGMCVMEAVAYFAGEKHSDAPACACPVLTSYMINLNDSLKADERQLLKPYIKKLIGTRDGKAYKRAKILAWASIVEFTPYCLELIGLKKEAITLKKLPAYDWSAAESAVESAAESAAYSAARSAAYSAYSAYSAARAAESAVESAAYSAESAAYSAESAAYSAEAAAAAARSAAEAAYSAARSARSVDETSLKKEARLKVVRMALKALDQALKVK